MLTTCAASTVSSAVYSAGTLADTAVAYDSVRECIVSLHHAVSHKAVGFHAIAGSFRSPGQVLLLWYTERETESVKERELRLSLHDLDKLLVFIQSIPSTMTYSYDDLVALSVPTVWTMSLSPSVSLRLSRETLSHQVGYIYSIGDRAFVVTAGDAQIYTVALSSQRCLGHTALPYSGTVGSEGHWTVLSVSLDPLSVSANSPMLTVLMSAMAGEHKGDRLVRVSLKEIAMHTKS